MSSSENARGRDDLLQRALTNRLRQLMTTGLTPDLALAPSEFGPESEALSTFITLAPPTNNLPRAGLRGRDDVLAHFRRILPRRPVAVGRSGSQLAGQTDKRLHVISGLGGCGKSAVATAIPHLPGCSARPAGSLRG